MSVIRRNSSRSETRKKRSAPYARGLVKLFQVDLTFCCVLIGFFFQFGTFARFFGFLDPSPVEDSIESDGDATNRQVRSDSASL